MESLLVVFVIDVLVLLCVVNVSMGKFVVISDIGLCSILVEE